MQFKANLKQQRGINMVELLVTIVISTVGLLGLSALLMKINQSVADSGNRTQALWILEDLGNRMRLNKEGAAHYVTTNEYACPTNTIKPKHCASDNLTKSEICNAEEMAAFDLWDVACPKTEAGSNNDAVLFSNGVSYMADAKLEVNADPANPELYVLKLSWLVRSQDYKFDDPSAATTGGVRDEIEIKVRP